MFEQLTNRLKVLKSKWIIICSSLFQYLVGILKFCITIYDLLTVLENYYGLKKRGLNIELKVDSRKAKNIA